MVTGSMSDVCLMFVTPSTLLWELYALLWCAQYNLPISWLFLAVEHRPPAWELRLKSLMIERGNWIGNSHVTLFLMYGVSAHPLIQYRFHLPNSWCASLLPHRVYSEVHLLYCWIHLEPVCAQHGLSLRKLAWVVKKRYASLKNLLLWYPCTVTQGLFWGSCFAPLDWCWTSICPKWQVVQFYSWRLR